MKTSLQFLFIFLLIGSLAACQETIPTKAEEKPAEPQPTLQDVFKEHLRPRMLPLTQLQPVANNIPRSLRADGSVRKVTSRDWTSGFFPGTLWLAYQITQDLQYKQLAEEWTMLIEKEKTNGGDHDIGFKINCSFGEGIKVNDSEAYKEVIITSAKTLSRRYNKTVGSIRSWDFGSWKFPVIIDNMMNLELLYVATELSGDTTYASIATQHALTTLTNHFRADNSSYHVVDYDPATSKVRSKGTHQGYGDETAWARGQAWGLYGFTMCYGKTKNPAFLEQAQKIATFMLNHPNLPADKVPYWDFNAPDIPQAPRDVSAAAIIASALYELQTYVPNNDLYKNTADTILESLLSDTYLRKIDKEVPFLLEKSTGNKPKNDEISVPINYADYYFLEALYRKYNGI